MRIIILIEIPMWLFPYNRGSEQLRYGAQNYDKTASDLSVEQFLTLVSFDSKGKLEELGVNIDPNLIISSCSRLKTF